MTESTLPPFHASNLPRRVAGALRRRILSRVAPIRQARLTAAWQSDPRVWTARANAAIDRGLAWFSPQDDLTMSALYVLWQSWRRGSEPRFAMIHDKITHYRQTIRDPALRLFDPSYDPDSDTAAGLPDIMKVRPYLPTELLMIEAVWADVRDPGPGFLDRIAAIADGAGYGTTHIVVAAELMLRSGAFPPAALHRLIRSTIEPMDHANRRASLAADIFAERALMLFWAGEGKRVTAGQIVMLLRRQRADGGWDAPGVAPVGQSNQHTTALALAVIAEFLAAERSAGTRP